MSNEMKAMKQRLEKVLWEKENRIGTIRGVRNLSRADVEMALMHIDLIERGQQYGMRKPDQNVGDLFKAFKVDLDPYYGRTGIFM